MDKFDELLKILQGLNITQTEGEWSENLSEDIWKKYFVPSKYKIVRTGLDVDSHRWFETSTEVIKIYGRFLGISYITNLFSESMDYEDCNVPIEFFEMKKVQSIGYVKI